MVDGGRVCPFEGSLDDYPAWLMQRDRQMAGSADQDQKDAGVSAKQRRSERAQLRKRLQPLKRAVARSEKEMDQLQAEVRRLELELGDPALYQPENKERLNQLLQDKGRLDKRSQEVEEAWLQQVEQLEEAARG